MIDLRVSADPAGAAAELLAEAAVPGAQLALSGGGTVGRAYAVAAGLRDGWDGVHVWFGDDRAVPPDDERSNFRLVRESLLDALATPPVVHRIQGELGAEAAAELYDGELAGVVLDLALNGLGADGHTASLFPESTALEADPGRLVVMNTDPTGRNPHRRMTLTFSGIARARLVVVTVEGEGKRDAFAAVRRGDPDLPATRIQADQIIWLVDAAAAG